MSHVLDSPPITDGRWLRSVRTRAAIIDAWLALVQEGDLSPTARSVADRARIGLRTVFQHFPDMQALHIAACEEFVARLRPSVVRVDAELPLVERITMLATNRGALFDACTQLRLACERQAFVSPPIHELVMRWEAIGSADVLRIFSAELERVPSGHRRAVRYSVDAMFSWGTWYSLRAHRGLDPVEARMVMISATCQLLMSFQRTSTVTDSAYESETSGPRP